MFKNILIPVSSEFYTKKTLERGVFLAKKYKSDIKIVYIIEEKTIKQTDKLSGEFRTHYNIESTKKEIIGKQKQTAEKIIFEDANSLFKNKKIPFEVKITEGEFSTIVKNEVSKKSYDLILMGFERGCNLNYRLFDEIKTPIWVESKFEGDSILAVCSNLAPNLKVPKVSMKLAELFKCDLHMIYVVDMQDNVQVDQKGLRSRRKTEKDLLFIGENFVEQMRKKNIKVQLVKGNLEKEIIKKAEKIGAKLVIIGRQKKEKGLLGLPIKSIKKKIVEKCKYSMLFIN